MADPGRATECGDPDDLPLGDDLYYRDVGISGRSYQLYVPTSYLGNRAVPLMLDLHPWMGNTAMEERFNGFEEVAEEAGFVLARPQAVTPPGDAGPAWLIYGNDDVDYVEEVIADAATAVCVDSTRIYAAGMSQGGHFATQLACRLPGVFAAVASVGVVDHPVDCVSPPTPIIGFAGRTDSIYRIEEGLDPSVFESASVGAPPNARPGAFREEADAWASTNGCRPDPIVTSRGEGVERLAYRCPRRVETLFFLHSGGHVWPGPWLDPGFAEQLGIGVATDDIDASWTVWRFFRQHRSDP